MTALLLFASTFCVVFALGLQSLNVNRGHLWLAAVTSLAIGTSNLVLFKVLPGPTDAWQIAAYMLGGPFGIVASMRAHPHIVRLLGRLRTEPSAARRPPTRAELERLLDPGYYRMPPLQRLALDLIDPEQLAHAATPEIRERARAALGLQTIDPSRATRS